MCHMAYLLQTPHVPHIHHTCHTQHTHMTNTYILHNCLWTSVHAPSHINATHCKTKMQTFQQSINNSGGWRCATDEVASLEYAWTLRLPKRGWQQKPASSQQTASQPAAKTQHQAISQQASKLKTQKSTTEVSHKPKLAAMQVSTNKSNETT